MWVRRFSTPPTGRVFEACADDRSAQQYFAILSKALEPWDLDLNWHCAAPLSDFIEWTIRYFDTGVTRLFGIALGIFRVKLIGWILGSRRSIGIPTHQAGRKERAFWMRRAAVFRSSMV